MPSLLRTARTPRMVLTKLRVHDGLQIDSDSSSNHRVELLLGTVRCPDVMSTTLLTCRVCVQDS